MRLMALFKRLVQVDWFQGLLVSFSAATFAVAQPVYNLVAFNPELREVDGLVLVYLIVMFHAFPTAVVFVVDRMAACSPLGGKGLRLYRITLFAITSLSVLRQSQILYLGGLSVPVKFVLLLSVPALVIALCVYLYRALNLYFVYLSVVAILVTGVFIYRVGLLHAAWQYQYSAVSLSKQASDRYALPVFILLFDGLDLEVLLKDGQFDGQRFPNFKALADDGVWFANATTTYPHTRVSVPSLLTSTYISPKDRKAMGGFTIDGFKQKNILSVLSRHFNVTVFGEHLNYCFDPAFSCRGVPYTTKKSPYAYLWEVGTVMSNAMAPKFVVPPPLVRGSIQQFEEVFLASIKGSEARGRVYYQHNLLPHAPFIYDEKGNLHHSSYEDFPYGNWAGKKQSLPMIYENYTKQVKLADSLLGKFIAKLKSEGIYEESVIVVTTDHGAPVERFLVDGQRLQKEMDGSAARIPLLIHAPGLKPHISDVDYQHIDFKPTLLELLGIPADGEKMDGVSAFAANRPVRDKVFLVFESTPRGATSFDVGGVYLYDSDRKTWRLSAIPLDTYR